MIKQWLLLSIVQMHLPIQWIIQGFWGILKREMYYGKRFTSKEELIQSIQDYIEYYNNRRLQRKLHIMTPMAFHELTLKAT